MDFKILESIGLYDYLSNYGDKLSKSDIINLFKEYSFSVHENAGNLEDKILKEVIESYKERYL